MGKNSFHVSQKEAFDLLQKEDHVFVKVLEDGNMSVEYFAPKIKDTQSPHRQDELYIIAEGYADFYRNGEIVKCKKGDVLFVPAKMEHRFMNFSEEFATWVIFYGEKKT